MKGFNPKWKDLPDYILGITKEIWEDRNVHTLHHYYTNDMAKRGPDGIVIGNQAVINETLQTLSLFPDTQAFGEDVIWSGNDTDGFLSSHRVVATFTHSVDGPLGPATGKKLTQRVFADCACLNDQIYDEWLLHDVSQCLRQLGRDPKSYAAAQIESEGGPQTCRKPFTPAMDVKAKYQGRGNDHAVGQRYAAIMQAIMGADIAVIPRDYDRACHLELPGGITGHGWPAADRFWLGLRAAFPNARFEIHHQIGRDDPGLSPRAALRWSLTGKHEGWGAFGQPSGADVHVIGFSHAEFGPWGLRREYVLIDEVQVWKQILLQTG